ncbi:MAG: glycosyltransferase [Ilumatobacteraceae bacterium]
MRRPITPPIWSNEWRLDEPNIVLIRLPENIGHGPALRIGWEAAVGTWVAHLDSDDEIPADQLRLLWEARHDADLVLGVRTNRSSPPVRRFVTWVLRQVAFASARRRIADANTPCKLVRHDTLARALDAMPSTAFAPSILLAVDVVRTGGRLAEVPVTSRVRVHGRSSLVPTRLLVGSARSLRDTVAAGVRRRPRHHLEGGLRVLAALQYYTPHRTGLTLYAERLAQELVRTGTDVTIVTARHDRSYPRRAEEAGVVVRRLWAPLRVSRGMVMPFHPVVMWREMSHADVVHLHSPMLELPVVALLCRVRRRPLVLTHHGDLVLPDNRRNRWIEWVVRSGWNIAARRAASIVAYSDDYARASSYLAPFRERIEVIPPPVRIPAPRPERVAALRQAWGGGPIVGFVGRFVEEKRPDVALLALDVVRDVHPTARLVFAGQHDIAYEDTWDRCADLVSERRDHLTFLGLIDDPRELADVYAACDVVILPSDSECFALVQVEAMLCGTPVVASDLDGARVPVVTTGMGRLVPRGDHLAFGHAVLEVIADPSSLTRTPAEIEAALGLDQTVQRYEKVLRVAAGR